MKNGYVAMKSGDTAMSMGDLQDPIHGGTLVPYFWSIFCEDIPLHRPEI